MLLADWSLDKKEIVSDESHFQRIEIWEVTESSVDHFEDPETGADAGVDRQLLLDGVTQVNTDDEGAYHEALVHPALALGHATGAERVLVLGGGDGGAIREVLKHSSVKEVSRLALQVYISCLWHQDREKQIRGGGHDSIFQ